MSATFYDDLDTLCQTPVVDFSHAEQVLDVLADLISDELDNIDDEYLGICCGKFVNSIAYKHDLRKSHSRLVEWLVNPDKMQTQRLQFIGSIIRHDLPSMIAFLYASQSAITAIIDVIWMYRFTEPRLVETFLLVLYGIFERGQLDEYILDNCFNEEFLHFLYRSVRDSDSPREPLIVLVALNDQYMLHGKRGSDNQVFAALKSMPSQYCAIGSSIVFTLNRCNHEDQDLKIFICKFLYLIFTTPSTADLLYTNDLTVFAEIMIRELNDLPLESVDVRAMYLRVLYAMLVHSPIEYSSPQLRNPLIQVLQLTIDAAENLDGEDKNEIYRLGERCLEVPWLKHGKSDPTPHSSQYAETHGPQKELGPDDVEQLVKGLELGVYGNSVNNSYEQDISSKAEITSLDNSSQTSIGSAASLHSQSSRSARPPVPPPPRPPPRHHSVASIASTDSRLSFDTVVHFRPPPPLPRKR